MRDDFLTRDWADRHATLSGAIGRLANVISVSLDRLHRYEFDAPWKRAERRCEQR